jgi:hypothetical protein
MPSTPELFAVAVLVMGRGLSAAPRTIGPIKLLLIVPEITLPIGVIGTGLMVACIPRAKSTVCCRLCDESPLATQHAARKPIAPPCDSAPQTLVQIHTGLPSDR